MQRVLEYIVFFVAVVLLQALLFDNLMIAPVIIPLYYVVFMLLLPVDTSRMGLLMVGLVLGVIMDLLMGTPGLNTMATVAVAYLRPVAMNLTMGKELSHENIPYGGAIGDKAFFLYATLLVVLHGAVFFGFESLGSHLWLTLAKVVCSSAVVVVLSWLTARIFSRIIK